MPADGTALNSLRSPSLSTGIARSRVTQRRPGRGYLWACLVALGGAQGAHAGLAADEAADYENRIEFAYFSEDAQELSGLVRSLTARITDDDGDRASKYLLAHADYRLAQVLEDAHKPGAESAAKACVAAIGELSRRGSNDAESFAQEAACHGLLAGISVMRSVTQGPAASEAVATALELGPKNPRARLADALVDYWRPAKLGGDRTRAFSKFRQAAELFEAQAPGSSSFPSWGNADVYLWLGRACIERGDVAAARSALERALIIAPDFAAARRQLARLATH